MTERAGCKKLQTKFTHAIVLIILDSVKADFSVKQCIFRIFTGGCALEKKHRFFPQ